MATKRKVPELRFKGFEGEWEEKRLGEIGKTYTGLSGKSKADFGHGDGHYITYLNVFANPVAEPTAVEQVELDMRQNVVNFGDVLFTTSSETPEEVGMSSVILHETNNTYLNSFCFGYRPNVLFDNHYLAFMLRSSSFRRKISYLAQGISRYNISKNRVMELSISLSGKTEQSQIGTFFQNLDALITLHQRQYDKLTTVKKAMLQKLFPQDSADVPQIRFQGFTGSWEKRDLGGIYSERNERGNDSLPILSVSIHHGISSGELDAEFLGKQVRRSEDKSLYKHVYPGDLVFNMMRAWQGAVGVTQSEGMVSPAYVTAVPSSDIYPLFMDCCLRREVVIYQMNNLSYGVTDFRKRLYWDSFVRVSCLIPSVSEQKRITNYFTHLDSLIALEQRQLEKLKNLKKACLDKMFV